MTVADPPSESRTRTRLLIALKLVVSTGLLLLLFQYADMGSVFQRLVAVKPWPLFYAFLLLGVQVVLGTIKWRQILRSDGLELRFPFLLRVNATSSFVGLFLPSGFGGDIYRVAALRSASGGLVRSTASVLFDRGTGLFALVTISVISYQFYPGNVLSWAFVLAWLAAIGLFVLATSRYVLGSRMWPSMNMATHFRSLLSTLRIYRNSGRLLAATILLSLLFQLIMVVINWFYAQALDIDIPFMTLLVIIPLIYLTEAIPLSISGIGIRDSAFVIAFAAIGHTAEEALSMSLILISMRYVVGFICGSAVLVAMFTTRQAVATSRTENL